MTSINELEEDAANQIGNVKEVGLYALKAEGLLNEVEALAATLKERQKELRQVLETDLPQAMDAANCKKFETAGGRKIVIQDIIRANIPGAKQEEAFAWLRDNGHDSLIKHELKVTLDRGKDNLARELGAMLERDYGVLADDKTTVHAQTLSAFCREQLAGGIEIPGDLLGLYTARHAKIN